MGSPHTSKCLYVSEHISRVLSQIKLSKGAEIVFCSEHSLQLNFELNSILQLSLDLYPGYSDLTGPGPKRQFPTKSVAVTHNKMNPHLTPTTWLFLDNFTFCLEKHYRVKLKYSSLHNYNSLLCLLVHLRAPDGGPCELLLYTAAPMTSLLL